MSEKKKTAPIEPPFNESQTSKTDVSSCTHYTPNLQSVQDELAKKFVSKKNWSEVLSQTYSLLSLDKRAYRVGQCGSILEFKVYFDGETPHKLNKANFCRDRLCPMCNWRRSLKIMGQVSQIMNAPQMAEFEYLFLTLTVKNCSAADLQNSVQKLFDGWRYLYNKNSVFKKAIQGTFRSFEITRNGKDGTYHPHLHCILAVLPSYFKSRYYISQAEWSALWQKACGLEYNPIVHIQKVKDNGKGLSGVVAEVAKYAVKGSDMLDKDDIEKNISVVSDFLKSLTGRHLCSFTGVFQEVRRQLKLDDAENGDLVHTSDEDLREDVAYAIVRFGWKMGSYVQVFD